MTKTFISLVAATILLTTRAHAEVIVVNPALGESVQAAVDAAAPGDTLLIQGIGGLPFEVVVLTGKGLTLIGDVPGSDPAFKLRRIAISNIPASQSVTILNMDVGGTGGDGLILRNSPGALRFVEVRGFGAAGQSENAFGQIAIPGYAGTTIENCQDVVFARCFFSGGPGGDVNGGFGSATSPGGSGLLAIDSTIALFESAGFGGDGGEHGFIFSPLGSDGGAGATSDSSALYLFNSSFVGGDGGENIYGGSALVSGGPGFVQTGSGTLSTLRDSSFAGGVGVGFSPDGNAANILDGPQITYPTSIATLEVEGNSPVREGEAITLRAKGLPGGTQQFLLVSFSPGFLSIPSREGVLTLGLPLATDLLFLGTSPAITFNNDFSLGTAPALPAGFDALHLSLQGVEASSSGTVTLGTFEHLTLLAGTF